MPGYTLFPSTTMGAVAGKPQRLTIQGFTDEKLFVVKLDGGVKPNFQLMYAIGPGIFLNAFQQRMSVFNLEGLHILTDCVANVDTDEPAFFRFYKAHNIVSSTKMLTMAFNKITMTGYLIDLKIQNYNQDNVEGYLWNLQFLGWINNLPSAKATKSTTGTGTAQNTLYNRMSSVFTVGGQRFGVLTAASAATPGATTVTSSHLGLV